MPHRINYQGYLTNPAGAPVNASVPMSMALNLYNVPMGGTTLYTETQTVTVTNGVFNVFTMLGIDWLEPTCSLYSPSP